MAGRSGRGEGPAAWLAATGFLVCCLVAATPLAFPPRPGRPVAAVFPPWWDARRALAATALARAVTVRAGAWPSLVVAADAPPPYDAPRPAGAGAPTLGERLRAAGAWLILDPQSLRGCSLLPEPS